MVKQWVHSYIGEKWANSTQSMMASKFLSCIRSVGYVSKEVKDNIEIRYPQVSETALQYLMYALREIEFEGSLLENPYLKSVGLTGSFLTTQLSRTPSISVNQVGDVFSLEWKYRDLLEWAEHELFRSPK